MKAPKTRSAPLPTLGAVHLSFASICTGIHISLQTYSLTDPLVVRRNILDLEKHNLNIHCTTAQLIPDFYTPGQQHCRKNSFHLSL